MSTKKLILEAREWARINTIEIDGKWYWATWNDKSAQWTGPLHPEIVKKSGCSGWFARSSKGIPGAGGYSWNSRKSMLRAIRNMIYNGHIFSPFEEKINFDF